VEEVKYRPSEFNKLKHRISTLSEPQQLITKNIINYQDYVTDKQFNTYADQEKAEVITTAYQFLRYDTSRQENGNRQHAKLSRDLLSQRSKLNASTEYLDIAEPLRVENGHRSKQLTRGLVAADKTFLQIAWKPAFHSILDNADGFPQGAELNFFDLGMRAEETDLSLEQFSIIEIKSYSPRDLFFKPYSWGARLAYDRVLDIDGRHLTPHVEYDFGAMTKFIHQRASQNHLFLFSANRLEHNAGFDRNTGLASGFKTGWLHHHNQDTAILEWRSLYFMESDTRRRELIFGYNRPLAVDSAFRISLERTNTDAIYQTEAAITYAHHF
jgi:hypothetical protein